MPGSVKEDIVIIPTGNKESEKWEDFDAREEILCFYNSCINHWDL